MSVIINASTTSGLVMTSDLSGNLQFQNNGVNLPMGGVAPAFSAYRSTTQALTLFTNTKIVCDTKEFDTNNNFASGTFTPTVAGYYQISAGLSASAVTQIAVTIYKNGSPYKILISSNSSLIATGGGSCLVYCNGTTDYIDYYGNFSASINTVAGSIYTWFAGCLVRGA
jgi:hypothetical protein